MIDSFKPGEFLKHLDELRRRAIRIITVFLIASSIFIIFKVEFYTYNHFTFPILYPDPYHNVGSQFLALLEAHILPAGMKTVAIKPTDGMMADLYSCMFLAISVSMPVVVNEIWQFVRPALTSKEIKSMRQIVLPGTVLFLAGAVFGIWFIAPGLFMIFNNYDIGLSAVPYLSIMNFVSFVVTYVLIFGISFEIPVFMVALTSTGLVPAKYWKDHWRYAVIGAFVFGMIFSPGVTGFTMTVMAVPMIGLYIGGIYFAQRAERKSENSSLTTAEA